ncbi:LacI family DNA-binding transcriptional regulator [Dysgonomonas sp. ZJ279]|uniref:LacI family DNA-binding transcriptional regulator n=1 Tax=Dysgonomonas sp. ZJ279 TaxID=2709796 RepID=UPI0013EE18A5|nr:substrate-binding domain-containing protein [Dysgonomonas sp. ZJ279]
MKVKENYKSILNILQEQISHGILPFGSLLPTENDLAQKYGVSRPTITKVYNTLQHDNYVVKKKGVGTKIVYQRSKNKLTFGLLLPGVGESEIFSIISNRFLQHSRDGEFDCLWEGATTGNADMRKDLTEKSSVNYIEQKVDGVFFAPLERIPMADEINREICEKFANSGIPLVLLDRDIVEFPNRSVYDLVSLDNFNAGYTMAEHLLDAGCTIINFVYRPNSAFSVILRYLGAAAAIHKRHLQFDKNNVYCGEPENLDFVRNIKFLSNKTGIICANDSTAAMLMSSMDAINVKITLDILICGFDDMKYASHLKSPLTSYAQPCEEITDVAIELMMRRIHSKEAKPINVSLLGQIIPRASTEFST